jgi:hypothetical protein
MIGKDNQQHFAIIEADVTRQRVSREAIEDAIARGLDPGEVRCSDQS